MAPEAVESTLKEQAETEVPKPLPKGVVLGPDGKP
jgi:hypothetical protein